MATARGKALLAKLRADPKTRDVQKLAGWIKKRKIARLAAAKAEKAKAGDSKTSRADKGRKLAGFAAAKSLKGRKKESKDGELNAKIKAFRKEKSWLFDEEEMEEEIELLKAEHAEQNRPKSKDERDRERYEASALREMEYNERSRLHDVILNEIGGIKTSDSLREEYRQIPNNVKRKEGFSGDDVAMILANDYSEFGIESERDLIDFYANDYRKAA